MSAALPVIAVLAESMIAPGVRPGLSDFFHKRGSKIANPTTRAAAPPRAAQRRGRGIDWNHRPFCFFLRSLRCLLLLTMARPSALAQRAAHRRGDRLAAADSTEFFRRFGLDVHLLQAEIQRLGDILTNPFLIR